MFRILPVIREVDTLDDRSHSRFGNKEAKGAGPASTLPDAFHGRWKAAGLHLSLALGHGDIFAVEGDVLNTFLIVSLHQDGNCQRATGNNAAVERSGLDGWKSHLMQPLGHQTLATDRLHDLKDQIALLRETDLELEVSVEASKASGRNGDWGEVEDLEWSDSKTKKTVHCCPVIRRDDAYFGYGAQEGHWGRRHGGRWHMAFSQISNPQLWGQGVNLKFGRMMLANNGTRCTRTSEILSRAAVSEASRQSTRIWDDESLRATNYSAPIVMAFSALRPLEMRFCSTTLAGGIFLESLHWQA